MGARELGLGFEGGGGGVEDGEEKQGWRTGARMRSKVGEMKTQSHGGQRGRDMSYYEHVGYLSEK